MRRRREFYAAHPDQGKCVCVYSELDTYRYVYMYTCTVKACGLGAGLVQNTVFGKFCQSTTSLDGPHEFTAVSGSFREL